MVWSGMSTHETPQDRVHHSCDSTEYFARDVITTAHHGKGSTNHGTSRDILRGNQQPRHTKAPLLYSRSIVIGLLLCGRCSRRTPQELIDDTSLHDQKKKKVKGGCYAASYVPICTEKYPCTKLSDQETYHTSGYISYGISIISRKIACRRLRYAKSPSKQYGTGYIIRNRVIR